MVTFSGQVFNATGCAVTLNLYRSGALVWTHHYFEGFSIAVPLNNGVYMLNINGYTQGAFQFHIQGASNVAPPTPKTYNHEIGDSFNFQVGVIV